MVCYPSAPSTVIGPHLFRTYCESPVSIGGIPRIAYTYVALKKESCVNLFFFFFDNLQYIFQKQLEKDKARASSLQAEATEAGRLPGQEEKEEQYISVYFAAS